MPRPATLQSQDATAVSVTRQVAHGCEFAQKRGQTEHAAQLAAVETRRLHRATRLDVRQAERDLLRPLDHLRSEMLSDKTGARRVLELLLEGKVVFVPELDNRAYRLRASLNPARVTSSASPTGFKRLRPELSLDP